MHIPINIIESSQAEKFIKPKAIEDEIRKIIPSCSISTGKFSAVAPGFVHDFEWNHLDQMHRNYVHDAYHDAMRVVTSKDFALSVTRWKNWPVFIQVSDVRISSNLYYQFFTLMGLLYCHQVTTFTQLSEEVEVDVIWYTASHWLLRPLHLLFNRMLYNLQAKQSKEDFTIRARRYELRKHGYKFKTDWPNYLNSNVLTDHVIPPVISTTQWSITDLVPYKASKRTVDKIDFFVMKDDQQRYFIWPGMCPHEGAAMPKPDSCSTSLSCPWHGRNFKPAELKDGGHWTFLGLKVQRVGETLSVANLEKAIEKHPQDSPQA